MGAGTIDGRRRDVNGNGIPSRLAVDLVHRGGTLAKRRVAPGATGPSERPRQLSHSEEESRPCPVRSAVTRDERRPARLAFTDDELLAQTLRERYLVPVERSDEADLLRTLLPKSFSPPGRPAPAAGITPNVDVGSPSPDIAAMVQANEVQRLQQLRADALTAQERLERVRQAHRDELEQRRAELKQLQETIRLEQKGVEAERQVLELAHARNSIEVERREIYID